MGLQQFEHSLAFPLSRELDSVGNVAALRSVVDEEIDHLHMPTQRLR